MKKVFNQSRIRYLKILSKKSHEIMKDYYFLVDLNNIVN